MPEHAMRDTQSAPKSPAAAGRHGSNALADAPTVQRLAAQKRALNTRSSSGGLPPQLKAGIEAMSGLSMDDVRVHRNSSRPATLQAHAYAQGTDIHLAPGQDHHLPHEAWHVVQQKQGRVRATMQLAAGVPVNDDAGLEREADVMGARALRGDGGEAEPLVQLPSPLSAAVQRSAITDNLEDSDRAWMAVEHEMDTIDASFGPYSARITALDGTANERHGVEASHGVRVWADNFRNKSLAYLTELSKAITRTGGDRLAALGTNTTTEPDLFILRGRDGVGEERQLLFGKKDHVEIKRTEGGPTNLKGLVRDATHQLVGRKSDDARNYIVECHAPEWYPASIKERDAVQLWAQGWVNDHVAQFSTSQAFAYGTFIVRIYYAQASVPLTASASIRHGR